MTVLLEPPGISALGKGSVFFLPSTTAIGGTVAAPTVLLSAFSSATNATCALDAGWDPTYEPGVGSRMKYCSTAEFETRGKGKWTGQNLVYEWDPQTPADVTNYKHVVDLAPGAKFKMALRLGLGKDIAVAADQYCAWIIPVELGEQVPVALDPSNDGQVLQLQQRYYIIGSPVMNVKVSAT